MVNYLDVYSVPYNEILPEESVLIYGAGKMGEYVFRTLKENGRNNILAFIDKNAKDMVNFYEEIQIYEPDMLRKLKADKIIVAIENYDVAVEIRNDLIKKGNLEKNVLICIKSCNVSSRTINEINKFLIRNLRSVKKRIFIFMLPEHGNIGDYLIGYSEFAFFEKYFEDYDVYGVTTTEWRMMKDLIINLLNINDVVCINGGGFFGDLRGDDVIYKDIVESFPENTKLFMPNTLTYSKAPSDSNENFIKDVQWIKKQKRMHIFLRERNSYEILKKYIDNCSLAPDMALRLNYKRNRVVRQNKVLLCLRNDCERTFEGKEQAEQILRDNSMEYEYFDIFIDRYVSQEAGEMLLSYAVKKFQSFDCVITDRLHGMLIATISKVPCIAFDNSTHKISGVWEWIKEYKYIEMMDGGNISSIMERINCVCDDKTLLLKNDAFEEEFMTMATTIKTMISDNE